MRTYNTFAENRAITAVNDILVFKTNINTEPDKLRILTVLNAHDEIQQCNIDLQDVDCVLRIVTGTLTANQVISIIQRTGFQCAELE